MSRQAWVVLALLAACAHEPPTLFPSPIPLVEAPPPPVFEPALDECRAPAAMVTGRPSPYVVEGNASCRAQVLPESMVVELVNEADEAAFWGRTTEVCLSGRAEDRIYAQAMADMAYDSAQVDRVDAQALRWLALGGIAGAFVGGVMIGMAFQ